MEERDGGGMRDKFCTAPQRGNKKDDKKEIFERILLRDICVISNQILQNKIFPIICCNVIQIFIGVKKGLEFRKIK